MWVEWQKVILLFNVYDQLIVTGDRQLIFIKFVPYLKHLLPASYAYNHIFNIHVVTQTGC